MKCIYSHEGGAYCDKHDHGAVTVGCCGEESCPDKKVLTMDEEYVSKEAVLRSIHNGNIDMGLVTPHEYRLLEGLSIRIDRRIQSVPAADVQPVRHGRWIPANDRPRSWLYRCSECDGVAYYPTPKYFSKGCGYRYCTNCGAKMDKEE